MYVEYKTSWEKRALAVLLAVVFVFVGMPYVGVETSFEASAHAAGNGKIIQVPTYSQYMGQSGYTESHGSDGTPNGTYTGKILPQSVNMYDYLTDDEKNNNHWNKLSENETNYTYYSRYEPYKLFNRAISAIPSPQSIVSEHENNITIKYISDITLNSVSVILKDPSNNDTAFSAGEVMTANAGKTEFTYTFNVDDLGFSGTTARLVFSDTTTGLSTLDATGYYLINLTKDKTYTFRNYSEGIAGKTTISYTGYTDQPENLYFWDGANSAAWPGDIGLTYNNNVAKYTFNSDPLPKKFIFNRKVTDPKWQTVDIERELVLGHNYNFYQGSETSIGSGKFNVQYELYPDASNPTSHAEDITRADLPKLYQGYFLASNGNDNVDNNVPGNYTGREPENKSNGITTDNQKYTDFYWSANMAQRPVSNNPNLTKSSVTKMVDDKLNDDDLVAQGRTALPYFNSSWSGVSSGLMKCWEGNEEKSISFPFYEVLTEARNVAGGDSSTTQKATFYQFNSKDSTLHFKYDNTTPQNSYFEERQPAVVNSDGTVNGNQLNESIRAANGKVGFFPFNDGRTGSTTGEGDSSSEGNEKDGYKNNYGFGSKFEMTFKLSRDGKTSATHDSAGNKLASSVTPTKVNTRFEFNGDDDLWVFIDGNLVLDMGGAHSASYGYIDFAELKAYAANAIEFNVTNSGLGQDGTSGIEELSGGEFLEKIDGSQNVENNYYNPDTLHTMTIFYMERGMSESNLFIRFNFAAESNYNKLKVKEQTDFSGVNAGLQSLTKLAADNDVFKYKIQNANTNGDYVLQTNTPYPTQGNYVRQITADQENKTKLASATSTSPGSNYFDVANIPKDTSDNNLQLVKNTNFNWVDEYALNGAGERMDSSKLVSGKTDENGFMYLMYGTTAEDNADGKERKSSGEFEDQFTRYSLMRVTQQQDLRTPDSHSVGDSDAAANLSTNTTTPARSFSSYYDLSENYIFSTTKRQHINITNGQLFNFRNELDDNNPESGDNSSNADTDEHLKAKVIVTAQFVNTPQTGAITITKSKASNDPDSITSGKTYKIKVRFEDIFGVTGVNGDADADYSNIKYKVYSSNGTVQNDGNSYDMEVNTTPGGDKCGTISLNVNQTATIEGIPVGTKYYIYEEEPKYMPSITPNSGTVAAGTISYPDQSPPTSNGTNNNTNVTNYSNSLTIKEVTDFSTVNAGLRSYTKTAAENDVFKYTVANQGTTNSDVYDSGLLTPTTTTNTRTNNDKTTQLTGVPVEYDTTHIYLDTSQDLGTAAYDSNLSGRWDDRENTWIVAYLYTGNSQGNTYKMEKVDDHLYRVDTYGFETVHFFVIDTTSNYYNSDDKFPIENWTPKNHSGYCNRCKAGVVIAGATYKITGWGSDKDNNVGTRDTSVDTPRQIVTTVTPATANYQPGNDTTNPVAVSNTNYEWKDEFASPNNTFTEKTTNTGDLYLMHGTVQNNTTQTANKESSATFYNQFKRDSNSIMTVEQVNTLYSPDRTQTPDALGSTGQRTSNTLGTYYTMSKSLLGSQTAFSPVDSSSFIYNETNPNKSVQITETFTNTVKVGGIKVTKTLSNNDTATDSFTFQLTLNNVFGVTNNNVANNGYGSISAVVNNVSNPLNAVSNPLNADGTFTLQGGQYAEIKGIPVGTSYTITEASSSNYTAATQSFSGTVAEGVLIGSATTYDDPANYNAASTNTHTFTNTRNTGSLTISKAITGEGASADQAFNFTVSLSNTELTLSSLTFSYSDDSKITSNPNNQTIIVNLKGSESVTISGIPYGTTYTVTEGTMPSAQWSQSSKSNDTGTINSSTPTASFTNEYSLPPKHTVTLNKVNPTNDNSLITTYSATFKLYRLPSTFDSSSSTDRAKLVDVVGGGSVSGYGLVGTYTTTNGRIIITEGTDANISEFGNNYYYFHETAAPIGYQLNSTVDVSKIFKFDTGVYDISVSYPNTPDSTSVDVDKVDSTDNDKHLAGAEFELHYIDERTPPTYSINEPVISPSLTSTSTLNANTQNPTDVANTSTITIDNYNYNAVSARLHRSRTGFSHEATMIISTSVITISVHNTAVIMKADG